MFDKSIETEVSVAELEHLTANELAVWEAESDDLHLIPDGWKVNQLRPGVYQLTSQLGHTYITTGGLPP